MLLRSAGLLLAACLSMAFGASAQSVSGTYAGGTANGLRWEGTFNCVGSPICRGTYRGTVQGSVDSLSCSNILPVSGAIEISGFEIFQPGSMSGSVTFLDGFGVALSRSPDGFCTYQTNVRALLPPHTGTWDGGAGSLRVRATSVGPPQVTLEVLFNFTGRPPVFGMTVTGTIGPPTANLQAAIQFRPQDIGTTQSVYVFALAPAGTVQAAAAAEPSRAIPKETLPVGCVLAQLNATGQLQQVSAADMRALVTNTLTSQGLAITVLNGVPTVQIAGATFFVGYGTSAAAMLNSGVNRSVATAPGAVQCKPSRPQTGWWWNPAEPGRGYSLEVQGNTMFFATYLYDAAGRATWYAAAMPVSLEGSYFTGAMITRSGGQTLDGAYRPPGAAVAAGDITIAFNDASHGTIVWPGGSVPIERFGLAPNSLGAAPLALQPESGWWWNPAEDGRGYYIEWQGANAFVAGYMYDAAGNATWYSAFAATPQPRSFQGTWSLLANGQPLTGAFRAPTVAIANVAPVTITFDSADTGFMTLPGGRTTSIRRFRF
ncbi:MAG TPA: hypothetical protein VFK48_16195 [Usitatibacter sp.]|nr:hypothetical protein [Usitatibacter sp.]